MKTLLVKSFTREFPLVHVQVWGRRYAKEFLGEPMPQRPIYVFMMKGGLVTAYRDVDGHLSSVNGIIKKKIEQDKDFIDHLVLKDEKILREMTVLKDKADITEREFVAYLDDLFDAWQLHYVAQFVPLDEARFGAADREKALRLRQTVDTGIIDCWNALTPMLKRLYPALGDLVLYISWDEIKEAKVPSVEELKRRAASGLTLLDGEIVSPEELGAMKSRYGIELSEGADISDRQELRGQVACAGAVRGRVRQVLKVNDIKRFQEGEILVSYMTMPTFMPAMKKAAAFVTDEGGITCHAAIIAREMNKPCIIGTKVATKILKDGNLVEVDADHGVVRILNID